MQYTHLSLKVNFKAEEFSEEYYQKIYEKEKKEYVEFHLESVKYFKKMLLINFFKYLIQGKLKQIKELIKDETEIKESFDLKQRNIIEDLKSNLPSHILNKVSDIRVLALNYASREVADLIKEYCEDNQKYVDKKINEYSKLQEKQFKNKTLDFKEESFHDCLISEIKKDNKSLTIKLNNKHGFTNKSKITFVNYNIILDEDISNSCWLYREIYVKEEKYEVHILTCGEELRELIIECDDIFVK